MINFYKGDEARSYNYRSYRMTKYEEFKNKANKCIEKAIATTDENLKKFFYNAAQGYEIKLAKLTITEAGEEV